MSNAATPARTINLIGIGLCPAKPASELAVGDILSWNYSPAGYEVTAIAQVSAKFLAITERNRKTGTETVRRIKAETLVAA